MVNDIMDNMTIKTTNDGSGEMTDNGVKKGFELNRIKNKIYEKLTKNLLT
jgi:hypothetical protein